MFAALEETNNLEDIRKIYPWSLDVENLYPSLKAEEVSKLVGKAFLKCELKVIVNTEDLSLYLALKGRSCRREAWAGSHTPGSP